MEAFTYGRRLARGGGGGEGRFLSIRERLIRIQEKKEFRKRLKILYEKKGHSICSIRDREILQVQEELRIPKFYEDEAEEKD